MSRAFWGIFVIMLGVIGILFISLFQTITNNDEHNSQALKEITEAAMWDAVDYSTYRSTGVISIQKEKFVENFIMRFAQNANLSNTYNIKFYDINETPPKVSIKIYSELNSDKVTVALGDSERTAFVVSHQIDAILETPY